MPGPWCCGAFEAFCAAGHVTGALWLLGDRRGRRGAGATALARLDTLRRCWPKDNDVGYRLVREALEFD